MDVVVKSRHCAVSEEFRDFVAEKITRLEKLDDRLIRVEVEVDTERNKRQHDQACCVEITLRGKGPVVRAEAKAEDKTAAFDLALDKLMAQLRRSADRRRVHHGARRPQSLQQASAVVPGEVDGYAIDGWDADAGHGDADTRTVAGMEVQGDGPLVVREKLHNAEPMSLDQALHAMELVGHDFYLYIDADHHKPSVVYRRRAYDYGVIRLDAADVLVG